MQSVDAVCMATEASARPPWAMLSCCHCVAAEVEVETAKVSHADNSQLGYRCCEAICHVPVTCVPNKVAMLGIAVTE